MSDLYVYDAENNPVKLNTPGIVARVEALEECGCGAITMAAVEVLQQPEALPIGQAQTFKFKCAPVGLAETTVDGVVVKIKAEEVDFSEQSMVDVDQDTLIAEWSFTTPETMSEETQFEITVYAVDSLGNKSTPVVLVKEAAMPFVRAPRITSPSNNAYVYPIAGFTATTSEFSTFMSDDTHASTDWVITSDAEGETVVAQVLASTDLLSHDFTPAELSGLQTGQTYHLFVRHNGTSLGAGRRSEGIALRARPAGVKAPEIVTPVQNSEIAFSAGVTITAGEFQTVGAEDTHATSDWKITSDAAGQDIICQANGSSDLTSHKFTKDEVGALDEGATYYAWVRYNGAVLGNGMWASVSWKAKASLPSGRIIYRHESDKGSVLEFDMFGKAVKLFVADAAYRTQAKFGTYGTDSPLANFSSANKDGAWYINGSASLDNKADAPVMTDAQLQALWPSLSTDKTARENCNVWMTYQRQTIGTTTATRVTGVPAVEHCRSLTSLFSGGCDLPTECQLMILYLESDAIDALDPTAEANPNNKIGKTHASGRFYCAGAKTAWSSTEAGSTAVRSVSTNGYCDYSNEHNSYSVLPIRELDSNLQPIA